MDLGAEEGRLRGDGAGAAPARRGARSVGLYFSPRRGQVLARLRELRGKRLAHDAPPLP